jgi:TonB family protein
MMRTLTLIAILGFVAVQDARSRGVTVSVDHSISVLELASEEAGKPRATPHTLPLPAYPFEMMRVGLSGEASLKFLVHKDGSVSKVTIASSRVKEFGHSAKAAVDCWKFLPSNESSSSGASDCWMKCRIVFEIKDS